MIRLPVPPGAIAPGLVALGPEEAHRARDVLRLREGDEVELFDGAGVRARARLRGQGQALAAEVLEVHRGEAGPALYLAQALAKGDKLELVIQKSTELGAAGIIPFASARTVVRLEGTRAEERVERWRKIAREAARQCGRATVPEVAPVTDLGGVLARAGARALLYEGERGCRLSAFLDAAMGPITLIVGPEGGFAPEEVERARGAGAEVVGLGPRILRTETVALAALAVALHRRGELG